VREVAALAVVVYHLDRAARLSYGACAPRRTTWLMAQSFLGVEVFFVLSDFVIAYSVRGGTYTVGYPGGFALPSHSPGPGVLGRGRAVGVNPLWHPGRGWGTIAVPTA
jgi:hypothetical protein